MRWGQTNLDQPTVRIDKTAVDVIGRALDQDDPRRLRRAEHFAAIEARQATATADSAHRSYLSNLTNRKN